MYSVKNLIVHPAYNEESANRIVDKRIKDPQCDKVINKLYIRDKGLYQWNNNKNIYYSDRWNTQLSINDLFNIVWDLSSE